MKIKIPYCGFENKNADEQWLYSAVKQPAESKMGAPEDFSLESPGKATVTAPKYHLRSYYRKNRLCKNCGEYVSESNVCPGCGKSDFEFRFEDKYSCSNPRKCINCGYESWRLNFCPKCGSSMDYIYPYIVGDFASDYCPFIPSVKMCSEDELIFEISESSITFAAFPEGKIRIRVLCNYLDSHWSVRSYPEWISLSINYNNIEIIAMPNKYREDRTCQMEICCEEMKIPLIIKQNALSFKRIRSLKDLINFVKAFVSRNLWTDFKNKR